MTFDISGYQNTIKPGAAHTAVPALWVFAAKLRISPTNPASRDVWAAPDLDEDVARNKMRKIVEKIDFPDISLKLGRIQG